MNDKKEVKQENIEMRDIESIIPYARNSRTHSDDQVTRLASSIREWGFTNPVLIAADGTIVAGHGRVMAARKLGMNVMLSGGDCKEIRI